MQVVLIILAVVLLGGFAIGFLTDSEGLEGVSEDNKPIVILGRLLLLIGMGLLVVLLFHMNN
ncbi:MAG TPA: hypothetical protein GXX50_06905 [Firmicutes bacterium]|nr:hypothetical protein [Bacillota bacterium]